MSATALTVLLTSILLVAALGGPRIIRGSAPALAAIPRVATFALTLAALIWIAALLAVGPVVAWMSSGPAWLPEAAARVCSRCLSESSPFGAGAASLGIPAVVPLALPAIGAVAVTWGLLRESRKIRRARAALAATLLTSSETITLLGHPVRVTRDDVPRAFSLPHRDGGVVVSRGTIRTLNTAELAAVLEHERAHLAQRHHVSLTVLLGATSAFRWIPLIRAIRDAVPHYLEIAADQAAKRATGTTALASALLKLTGARCGDGEMAETNDGSHAGSPPAHTVLHAAASDRIKSLVGQPRTPASTALAAAVGLYAFMLVAVILAINLPYVLALATGC